MSLADRYRRLRAKIFIREDLFAEAKATIDDATKLASRSTQLRWDDESLYRVLIRHMAAQGEQLRAWLQLSFQPMAGDVHRGVQLSLFEPPAVLPEPVRKKLGYLPPYPLLPDQQAQLVNRLAGTHIGRGNSKGPTWKWIPLRIQDARGAKAPRPLLNLIRYAAIQARENQSAPDDQLLTAGDLFAALKPTSTSRIEELGHVQRTGQTSSGLAGCASSNCPHPSCARSSSHSLFAPRLRRLG
jgi:hypothetical protein